MVHMALWWIIDDKKIFRTDDSEKYLWSFEESKKKGGGKRQIFPDNKNARAPLRMWIPTPLHYGVK